MNTRHTALALAIMSTLTLASAAWGQPKARPDVKSDVTADKASAPMGGAMPAPESASAAKSSKPRMSKGTGDSKATGTTKPQGEANQDKPKP